MHPHATPPSPMPRLHFANQLRGLAAVVVMFSHLVGVFWLLPAAVDLVTLTPPQPGTPPPLVTRTLFEWFQPGPFGVGLFFLVSGLVVPASLDRYSAPRFLAARALRIFPAYWAGLAVQLLGMYAAARLWHTAVPHRWPTLAANAFLVNDLVDVPSLDLVNWTLALEVRFYLLVAVLAPFFRAGDPRAVLAVAGTACAAAALLWSGAAGPLGTSGTGFDAVSAQLPFLVLMLAGTLFNFHVRRRIGTATLCATLVPVAAAVAFTWWFGVLRAQFTHVLVNDAYAFALFAALYAVRRHIPANRLLDALAAISYPLYLLHATFGFLALRLLMLRAGWTYGPSLAVAVAATVLLSALLHVAVEKPTTRLGHVLATARRPRPASLSPPPPC